MNVKMKFSETRFQTTRLLELDYEGEPGTDFDAVMITFLGHWDGSNRICLTGKDPGKFDGIIRGPKVPEESVDPMPIVLIIIGLIAIGVILEVVRQRVPIDPTILLLIRALIIAVVVVLILKVLGVWEAVWSVRI